uniref:Uncharacterized protein n=1 Tax=Panagrolaimus sp. PS1159 TaxID=55785 RepID=A0AC35GBC8_9BILA
MAVCVELKLTLLAFIFIEAALAETLKNEITLDWNNHPNGTYSLAQAINDFGNMKKSRWDETKVDITDAGKDNTRGCRVKMLPNELSEGGCGAEANIEPGQEYEVDFDMKFHSQFSWSGEFSWSGGGKVGFGFKMGQGNKTGCRPAWDGNGGSLRLVWIASGDRVFLRPYVYHYQMPKQCGDFFNKTYPVTENLKKGSWYHVSIYAKSNTGKNSDGWIRIVINND